ncbi:hypothetical protein [Maridesulfovibrio sp.]|uniref:capsular polysaccharide export protein, LipB/KpsS family n=1 Tax=Maridesulfovibrio sp. TaxID=2795000 RepID=UPI003BABC25D
MGKPTILFMSRERCDLFFIEAINELKDKYNVVVVASKLNIDKYSPIEGITIEKWHDRDTLVELSSHLTKEQLEKVKDIEKELDINCYRFNINYLLYEKFVNRYVTKPVHTGPNSTIPQRVLFEYQFLTDIIKKHHVDYAVFETIDRTETMILEGMAQKGIIKQAFTQEVATLGGELRLRITSGLRKVSKRITHVYNTGELNAESLQWAEQAVAKYQDQKPESKFDKYHTKMGRMLPSYSWAQIKDKFKRIRTGDSLAPALIKMKNRFQSTGYFTHELPEGDFISYFLQLTPEASMCSQVPEFANQEHMLEQIAIHGKYGYKLVIKEHPACFGNRSSAFYKELANLPNVVMLPPSFPTRDIILRSKAVVVASSTSAGIECVGSGTPVICLGNPFYSICKNNVKIKHPHEVWDVIDDLKIDKNEIVKFFAAVHQATYEHPQYDTPEEAEIRLGGGVVLGQALGDEIELYEAGVLQ